MGSQIKRSIRVKSRRVPSTGASVLWSWGVPLPWHIDLFTSPEAL